MSHYNVSKENPLGAITINFKFGAICKRSKARTELSIRKKKKITLKRFSQWSRNYSGYHSISHIKRIFKWLPSHFEPIERNEMK